MNYEDYILFSKTNKVFRVRKTWHPKTQKYTTKKYPINSLVEHLSLDVHSEEGFKFKTLWSHIVKDADFLNVIYGHELGHYDIKKFNEYVINNPAKKKKEDPDNSIHYLEVYWYSEIDNYEDVTMDPESKLERAKNTSTKFVMPKYIVPDNITCNFTMYSGLHGIGRITDDTATPKVSDTGYSMTGIPINEYMLYNLKINNAFDIYDMCIQANYSEPRSYKPIGEYKKQMTLYYVLKAILFEMTWDGYPEEQAKSFQKLKEMVSEVKDQRQLPHAEA